MTENGGFNPVKRFFKLLAIDRTQIVNIYIYALFSGLVYLSLPLGIQAIISFIMGGQVSVSWIVLSLLVTVGVLISGVFQVYQIIITENIEQKIFARTSFEFTYRIPRFDYQSVGNTHLPELVNRFFDTLSVQKGLGKLLIDFSTYSIQIIFGLILLSLYHPFFIAFSLILITFIYLIFRFTAPKGLNTSLEESKFKYKVAHWLEEIAANMETFKMAGNSDLTMERTDELTGKYMEARKKHFSVLLIQYYHMVGFKVLIVAGLLIIGGKLVIDQQMNIGQFVAAEIVILLVMNAVEKLILNIDTIYDVLTALEKIGSVTDIPLEHYDRAEKIPLTEQEGMDVSVKNLSFFFRDRAEKIIKNVNLEIKAGEKWCISGPSDAGKSILLKLISGFYEEYNGNITLNNVPLRNLSYEKLRAKIGNCANTEGIFMGTILENITLGRKDIGTREVQLALKKTGLDEDIANLRNGFNHYLDHGDHFLPKEIYQKIMWTRAIVGTPQLILYDDFKTSGSTTQKNVFWNTITDKNDPWTLLAISNDLSFIRRCDYAVIMEDGQISKIIRGSEVDGDEWFLSNCKN